MTAAAQQDTSKYWEQIFRIPLKKAQKLAQEQTPNLVDQVEDVLDRVAVDRLLIGRLESGSDDLGPGRFLPAKVRDWAELAGVLADIGTRLVAALEEVRDLVQLDNDRSNARGILQMARREGRIPPEGT